MQFRAETRLASGEVTKSYGGCNPTPGSSGTPS